MNEHGIGYYLILFIVPCLIGMIPGLIIALIAWIDYLLWNRDRKRRLKEEREACLRAFEARNRAFDFYIKSLEKKYGQGKE